MIKKEQLKIGLKIIPSQDCPAKRIGEYMEIISNENGEWQVKDYYGGISGFIPDKDLEYWDIFE